VVRRALRSAPRLIDVVAQARDLEDAQREQEKAERQLNAYVENADIEDPVLFQRGLRAREKRADEARAKVRELSGRVTRTPSGGSLVELWERFDAGQRRKVLSGFLGGVQVSRGASSDLAANVRVAWGDGTLAVPNVADDEERVGALAA
jgi:hypothetical protein